MTGWQHPVHLRNPSSTSFSARTHWPMTAGSSIDSPVYPAHTTTPLNKFKNYTLCPEFRNDVKRFWIINQKYIPPLNCHVNALVKPWRWVLSNGRVRLLKTPWKVGLWSCSFIEECSLRASTVLYYYSLSNLSRSTAWRNDVISWQRVEGFPYHLCKDSVCNDIDALHWTTPEASILHDSW